MRIVIYAKGNIFEKYKEQISWNNVVAIADKKATKGEYIKDIPVILPQDIAGIQYDYIAIFSKKYFEQIKNDLIGDFFVPEEKIVSWKMAIDDFEPGLYRASRFCKELILQKGIKRVIDLGCILSGYYLNKYDFVEDTIELIGVGKNDCLEYKYRSIYDEVHRDINLRNEYKESLLLLWGQVKNVGESLEKVECRYTMWCLSYNDLLNEEVVKVKNIIKKFGKLYCFSIAEGNIWLLDRASQGEEPLIGNIYVITHKRYNLPNYGLYVPLVVGDKYIEHNYLTEYNGKNIAYLNDKINECTALYWIWKNTDSQYVGLNHYRRRFYNNWYKNSGNYLDGFCAKRIMESYDVILPESICFAEITVLEQLEATIQKEAFIKGHEVITNVLKKKQPEYIGAFERVMSGHVMYPCNMFFTSREILNAYCEWLFSFLIEAAEMIDICGFDNYSKRVIGFFGERMWTVWLVKNDLKIKQLPITEV